MSLPRILVVDDTPEVLECCRVILTDKGYPTDVAANGRIAITKLAANDYGLVLLDMVMPDLDGMAVLRELTTMKHVPPIVTMSGYCDPDELSRSANPFISGRLQKPFGPAQLLEAVTTATRQELAGNGAH